MTTEIRDITLSGRVQGVGFRPFVYRLAHQHGIQGWVRNAIGRVEIHAEGSHEELERFRHDLLTQAPPLSSPQIEYDEPGEAEHAQGFYIVRSDQTGEADIHIAPDQYLCPQCEAELLQQDNRRYHYPFINCTQCGPRYTIIRAMPYDRANTSMEAFTLCELCHEEYQSTESRRFHAEPNACGECGPHLSYYDPDNRIELDSDSALAAAVDALRRGRILAVKGI